MRAVKRREWLIASALFVVAFAVRVPFRSQFAYHWDGAQLALAVQHYDLRIGLPHRPGYFLYVMAGRLVKVFVGDSHASLVWVSVGAGAALTALGYVLGTAMFGRRCGIVTAAILATSPLSWFASEVALTNIADAAAVTALAVLAWRAIQRGGSWHDVVALAIVLATVTGVRQQTAPLVLPLWLFTFRRFRPPRLLKLLAGLALAACFFLLWFLPMVQTSGGFQMYLDLLRKPAPLTATLTPWGAGLPALRSNVAMILAGAWAGLLLAGVLALTEFTRWLLRESPSDRRLWSMEHRCQLLFLGWWIVPPLCFGVAGLMVRPDYMLTYFPALALLAAAAITSLRSDARQDYRSTWLMAALTVAVNCVIFIAPFGFEDRAVLRLPITANFLREHDRQLATYFDAIRRRFRPDEVVLCHGDQFYYWGLRHFQIHLPEYENWLVVRDPTLASPFDSKYWRVRGLNSDFVERLPSSTGKSLVLVVPPDVKGTPFSNQFDLSRAQEWPIPGCPTQLVLPAQ